MKTRKILKSLLVLTLLLAMLPIGAITSNASDLAMTYSEELYKIGLWKGTVANADPPVFDLDKSFTRIEAIVMVIRLTGQEAAALATTGDSVFPDVTGWAVPYANFAYNAGISLGTGNGQFTPARLTTFQEFTIMLLRALGYNDSQGDFDWQKAVEFAVDIGLFTQGEADGFAVGSYLRGDTVFGIVNALLLNVKSSNKTLLDTLVEKGVISAADAAAFVAAVMNAGDDGDLVVFALPGGYGGTVSFNGSVDIALYSQKGAVISYKVDGGAQLTYSGGLTVDKACTIECWATKAGEDSPVTKLVFADSDKLKVDNYGQIIGSDYPVKIPEGTTADQLKALWASDEAWLATFKRPETWNEWGGLMGTKESMGFNVTGFYHIENKEDLATGQIRSYLVDPAGCLSFNISACVTDDNESFTVTSGRENVYQWLPDKTNPLYANAYRSWGGYETFSFFAANWAHKNNKPYNKPEFLSQAAKRLKDLGFTGIGAWSPSDIDDYMPDFLWLSPTDIRIGDTKYYDVFHPDFEPGLDANFSWIAANKDRKNVIGYLFDNERGYNNIRNAVLSQTSLDSGVKRKFIEMMQDKYASIDDFNAVWNKSFASWDEARTTSFTTPSVTEAIADFYMFSDEYFSTLYRLVAQYAKKYDPNHMVMGERLLVGDSQTKRLFQSIAYGSRYLDAISFNYYTTDPNMELLAEMYEHSEHTPFLLSEFHWRDMTTGFGFPSGGTIDETVKGLRYRNYVEKSAASGVVIGVTWFTYMDQAPTGRYFEGTSGEAFAIGFFNVVDRPYRTFIGHVTETNYRIYDVIQGNVPPFLYTTD